MKYFPQLVLLLVFLVSSAYVYDLTFVTTGKTSFADVQTTVIIPGCGNLVCSADENCPSDNVSCSDIKCYEPTCENGCGLGFVSSGLIDESCFGDTGCSGSSCVCDGTGNCVSSAPGVTQQQGGGGGVTITKKPDFTLNYASLTISLFEGETVNRTITVNNTGNTTLEFVVDTQSLINLVFLSDYVFELKPGEAKTTTLVVSASKQFQPDVYTGHIIFNANGLAKSIITVIEIKSKEALFDVSLHIQEDYRTVYQGEDVVFDIEITNLGELKPVDVELWTVLKDMFNNVLGMRVETIAVSDSLMLTRNFTLSPSAIPSNYVIYAKVIYTNNTAVSSDLFTVLEWKKVRPAAEERYSNWLLIFVIFVLLILVIFLIFLLYKRSVKKQTLEAHILKMSAKSRKYK